MVFNDSVAGAARNTFDSKSFGTHYAPGLSRTPQHISGLSRGRRIDLITKYWNLYRPNYRPMLGTRGPWTEELGERAIRLLSSHKEAVRPQGRLVFEVRSLDGERRYSVVIVDEGWSCDCTYWRENRTPCKHVLATVRWLDPNPPPILDESLTQSKRPSYKQADSRAYDLGQQQEHRVFDALLWDLLGTVSEAPPRVTRRGRPAIPLRTEILFAVRKVHIAQSSRRARGLLLALYQDGKGILPRVPNYTAPSRFFNRAEATDILLGLIEQSSLVLREIEDKGTVAIDSSGFSTSSMGAYLTEKHDPTRRHGWVKAHLAIGVKTHIVQAVTITDEHGADYSQFLPLLSRVKASGQTPSVVVADKAYLGRSNLDGAASLGFDPYIPFKSNSRGLSKRAPMWNRKFHEFMLNRDRFDEIYHRRSNVEATFSAIKRKLGEPLLSRNPLARVNELLAKILAYNVGVVIYQSALHGLPPGPLGIPSIPANRVAESASELLPIDPVPSQPSTEVASEGSL
ncbi:MAG TPA: transposase [Thermoplasmata archaeon]|nr:transposase [Thermoplasmata archaeon]